MRLDGALVTLCAIGVLALLWWQALPRVPLVNPAALVDIRQDRSKHEYSVLFSSRTAGLQGHAYIVWTAHPRKGPYHADGLGFYSTGDPFRVETLFGGPGEVQSEYGRPDAAKLGVAHTVVVWVDKEQFDALRRTIDPWRAPGRRYSLFSSDCIGMLHDVVAAAGLRAPRRIRIMTPDRYVQALIEANTDAWVATTKRLTGS
jgi:hypothetical protein